MKDRVIELLEECAEIRKERDSNYGSSYKTAGNVFAALFPDGLTLKTAEDFNRFCVLGSIVGKTHRYAPNFITGGHEDSLKDIANYALMLAELDEGMNNENS